MAEVLLVEDTEDLAEQIADIFKMEGHSVHLARNGSEALHLLLKRTITPDVIVTDLVMPGMDGFELIQQLRQSAELNSIPVIVMSAKSDKETLDQAASLEVKDFLAKPCPPEKLLEAVQAVVK